MERILFITSGPGFIAKAMIKGLEEADFKLVITHPTMERVDFIRDLPENIMFYFENDISGYDNAFKVVKTVFSETQKKCNLYLVGTQSELNFASEMIPKSLVTRTFVRPISPKEVIQALREENGRGLNLKKILLVDDDPVLLRTEKAWLENNYDVYIASSGLDAISFLDENSVDLVLLDYEMPEMSGLKTFEVLKKKPSTSKIPVIFLTGKDDKETVMKVLEAKPENYILKTRPQAEIIQIIASDSVWI